VRLLSAEAWEDKRPNGDAFTERLDSRSALTMYPRKGACICARISNYPIIGP